MLVDDHPFDVSLQQTYLEKVMRSCSPPEAISAFRLSSQFVDFDDSTWVKWLNAAKDSGPGDLAEAIMMSTKLHPSPAVLAACVDLVPVVVSHDWNSWSIFKPRPSARQSALRYVEHAIDKVSLWPESLPLWQSARKALELLGEPPQVVQKLWVRELQAVPMAPDTRALLLNELRTFEASHSLKESPVDSTRAEHLFSLWKELEHQVSEYPSMWAEMIEKRKGKDPEEYISSLHARSVLSCPKDPRLWEMYLDHISAKPNSENLVVEILERAVRNCPLEGSFWVSFAKLSNKTGSADFLKIIALGTSALRDSHDVSIRNSDSLSELLMMDCQKKLFEGEIADFRESFSNTVAVLSEISSLHAVSALVAWLHAESYSPKLMNDENQMVGILMSEFLAGVDFEDKRRACTPLLWIELAHIFQRNQDLSNPDSIPLCRMVYEKAIENLDSGKLKQVVLQDWILFERTFGSIQDVARLQDLMPKQFVLETRPVVAQPAVVRPSDTQQPEKKRIKLEPVAPPKRPHAEVVFVNNLAFSVDEYRIGKFFQDEGIGAPKRVVVVRDNHGKSKGFSYVEFDTSDQADEAMKLSGKDLEGRKIVVSPSNRPVTDKRPVVEPPKTFEEEKDKTNDYFRNLVLQKQKFHK